MNDYRHSICKLFRTAGRLDRGFSLLELIAALTLLALLAAIFGMGLVAAMQSHEFSRGNVHLTQKAQPAMARMSRELMELIDIEDWDASGAHPFILYRRLPGPNGQAARYGIHFDSAAGELLLYTDYQGTSPLNASTKAQGDILVDGVSNFTFNLKKDLSDWTITDDFRLLSNIEIALDLRHPGSGTSDRIRQFSSTVHLRNTTNFGGAAPATRPRATEGYSCFISCMRKRP